MAVIVSDLVFLDMILSVQTQKIPFQRNQCTDVFLKMTYYISMIRLQVYYIKR